MPRGDLNLHYSLLTGEVKSTSDMTELARVNELRSVYFCSVCTCVCVCARICVCECVYVCVHTLLRQK